MQAILFETPLPMLALPKCPSDVEGEAFAQLHIPYDAALAWSRCALYSDHGIRPDQQIMFINVEGSVRVPLFHDSSLLEPAPAARTPSPQAHALGCSPLGAPGGLGGASLLVLPCTWAPLLRMHARGSVQHAGPKNRGGNKAHVRRSMSACRGVSTPWVRVFRARSVRVEKTVCASLRRILLILIPCAVWHAAHVGCFACFIAKIVGLEPDAVRCMALRGWLRQAWRKSGS